MKRKTYLYRYLKKQGLGVQESYRLASEIEELLRNLPKSAEPE